jgi:hypothetical protein
VAVVQISKIQVRRGQKNTGIGVPQLSSAEFAWAVDSQELFIGNGSVAEGAPYVGNTKILTEHDNILELAASYQFAETEPSISLSVPRSLQTKLDEYVSVLDFGAVPDGSTDNLDAFENAMNELFRNLDSRFKKILYIPNGVYVFAGNLRIPSTAILQGETRDGVRLEFNANNVLFIGSNGEEVAEFTSSNRPQNIKIKDLTISRSIGQTDITGIADSTFENVRWVSEYELGDAFIGSISSQVAAVKWENSLPGTRVTDITFRDCVWESNLLSVRSDQIIVDPSNPPVYDTRIDFDNCQFSVGHTGILINGITNQGNRWNINDCKFEELFARGFVSSHGIGTKIQRSSFINCGNETNTAAAPITDIVSFGQSNENIVVYCSTNRHQQGGFTNVATKGAEVEVLNSSRTSLVDMNHADIYLSNSFRPLSVFSAYNRYTYIDYVLNLGVHSRSGQIIIMTPDDQGSISFTDNYAYSTPFITDPGGILMTSFQFNVELTDNNGDSGLETILVSYTNPLSTGTTGTISYSITYGV